MASVQYVWLLDTCVHTAVLYTRILSTLQQKTVHKDAVHQRNPPKFEKCEDMSNLTYLSEAAILHNLRSRYYMQRIYVSVYGIILSWLHH